MEKNNINRTRDIRVLIITALGFNLVALVYPQWSDSTTRTGGIVGVVALGILIVAVGRRWNKRLNKSQLVEARKGAKKVNSPLVVGLAGNVGILIYVVSKGGSLWPYILGFGAVLMAGGSLMAVVIAITKRGMYQESK